MSLRVDHRLDLQLGIRGKLGGPDTNVPQELDGGDELDRIDFEVFDRLRARAPGLGNRANRSTGASSVIARAAVCTTPIGVAGLDSRCWNSGARFACVWMSW